jgi:hypothetical protein
MNWITDALFALSLLGTFIIGLKEGRVIGYRQGIRQEKSRHAR